MDASIVLTGPMGSGKTSVGHLLARQLGYDFVDLDALIVEQEGSSINEVFARGGEQVFREMETASLATLADRRRIVLSTGGGVVLREENRTLLRMIGRVVNLTASVATLAERLAQADDRPLLQGEESREERLGRILRERERFYADADIRIDTTGKTLEDVAAEILRRLPVDASGAP